MGPSIEFFGWMHATALLALACLGLVVLIVEGVLQFRDELEAGRRNRAHRLAVLHDFAASLKRRDGAELEA